jgi:type VI secretion system protein VasG
VPEVEVLREALQPLLRRSFPPRSWGAWPSCPICRWAKRRWADIVSLHLDRVVDRMKTQHGIELGYTPALVAEVIERCGTHETGARRLIGFIEQKLLPFLSRRVARRAAASERSPGMSVDVAGPRRRTDHDLQGGGAIVCHTEYA